MSAASRRAALGALDRVRPLVASLHRNRPNEELAADLVQAWAQTEVVLRALLGGSTLAGQGLVREVRQRELLTLEQAHALVAFQAARDRAELPGHQVSAADVDAARAAVAELDRALGGAPVETVDLPPAPPGPASAPAAGAPATRAGRKFPPMLAIAIAAILLVVLAGGWMMYERRVGGPRSIEAAQQLYASGDARRAEVAWERIAEERPELALPHVYLGRIARDRGDVAAAQRELQTAIRLEPRSSVAQREMGNLLLATGNPDLARRFYARAVELDPDDRTALGYLGCSLVRIGQPQLARTFLDRAGPGEWSACATPAAPPPPGTPGF
ncbi:MAG TPA: tetratricopeptide repeat protein [Gemmatimonadales bacterium]